MFCYVNRAVHTHARRGRERERERKLRVKHRRTTAKIIMAWNVHTRRVCVRVTSFIICFSMQWQWQWQYHRYCERFGVSIFIPSDWIHWLRVRKPKNFVKSSHSSIIIRVLSVTCTFYMHVCLSVEMGVCVCQHTTSLSKVTKIKYFCRMYAVRVRCTAVRYTYAVLRLLLLVWRKSLSFFSKNHITRIISYFIKFNLMKPNPIPMHTQKEPMKRKFKSICYCKAFDYGNVNHIFTENASNVVVVVLVVVNLKWFCYSVVLRNI